MDLEHIFKIALAKNPIEFQLDLFEKGFFDKMLKNIGLSCEYTEDDLEILDDYFRNKRPLKVQTKEEAISRVVFAIYLCRIFEKNNAGIKMVTKKLDFAQVPLDFGLELQLVANGNQMFLYPMVKLGSIAFGHEDENDLDLFQWYTMSVMTYNIKNIFND